jgi:N-acetylmuramoyl-L-alanine amidase CwlA
MISDWRKIGPVPYETWKKEIEPFNRALAASRTSWEFAGKHSALALAQLWVESKYDSVGRLVEHDNPLGLRPTAAQINDPAWKKVSLPGAGMFLSFSTIAGCFAEWFRRITDPDYAYAETKTLEEYIHKYAPDGDGANNEAEYVKSIRNNLARWGLTDEVAGGGGTPVPTGIPVTKQIIPISAAHRPGDKLTSNWAPYGVTVHETGNTNRGANAKMHADYLSNGAEGRVVGWHLTVDDKGVYQHIPLDEMGYHASDGADNSAVDQGAYGTIAIETAVNSDGDWEKTKRNLAEVIARIEAGDPAFDWGGGQTRGKFGRIYEHYKFAADKKNCPQKMRGEGTVPQNGTIDQGPLFDMVQEERAKWGTNPGIVMVTDGMSLARLEGIWRPTVPDTSGPVFKLYVEEAKRTGVWPMPVPARWGFRDGGATYWYFHNGLIIWRPADSAAVRILK